MYGVNLSGAEFGSGNNYGTNYVYPSEAELAYYASQGVDTIRLPFTWERVQNSLDGSLNTDELGRIETFLNEAQANGLQVILDIHNYGSYDGQKIGSDAVSISDFSNLWSQLATALQGYTAVGGYDLMNEPNGFENATIWPAAAQAAIDAIRAVDTKTAIYVEGDGWSSSYDWAQVNGGLATLKDPSNNLVFEAHEYFDANNSGTYSGTYDSNGAYPDIGVDRLQSFANWLSENNLKGFIGEYSIPNNDPRWVVVMENFLAAAAKDGIPTAYWGAGPWWGGYPQSIEPQNGVDSVQMTTLEKFILAYQNGLHTFSSDNVVMPPVTEGVDATHLTGGVAALGVIHDDMLLNSATQATLSIQQVGGADHSTIGYYTVAGDGTIDNVGIAFTDAKSHIGDETTIALPADNAMGLFIIANGSIDNNGFQSINLQTGALHLYYDYGDSDQRLANVSDSGTHLSLVYTDASAQDTVISGADYFTTDRGADASLNADDTVHAMSGLSSQGDVNALQIGFEDQWYGGDHDYNDDVVSLTFQTPGTDTATEELTGGPRANIFVLTQDHAGNEEITNFNADQGDQINIHDVLQGADPVGDAIAQFVQITQQGANSVIAVDPTGTSHFAAVATVDNVHLDLQSLIAHNALVM